MTPDTQVCNKYNELETISQNHISPMSESSEIFQSVFVDMWVENFENFSFLAQLESIILG